jgi:hypothetical protein
MDKPVQVSDTTILRTEKMPATRKIKWEMKIPQGFY